MSLFRRKRAKSPEEVLRPHFDEHFYRSNYPEVVEAGIDPVRHYLERGASEGCNPTPWFSSKAYLDANPDIVLQGWNPFLHYIQHGREEGRQLPWLASGPEVTPPAYQVDPALDAETQLLRYLCFLDADAGADLVLSEEEISVLGREIIARRIESGTPLLPATDLALQLHIEAVRDRFDADFYADSHPDIAASGTVLISHYCDTGWRELNRPAQGFDPWFYWRSHLNADAPVMDPLLHYALVGASLGLETGSQDGEPMLMSHAEITARDLVQAKHDDWWAFPVCAYDHNLSGNDRAVFEAVRHDPKIRKIVLTRGREISLSGENVEILPLKSREGQEALIRSRVIFIKHSPRINVEFPLAANRHLYVGLWHGIPFKRIGTASLDLQDSRAHLLDENAQLASVISASPVDRLAMAAGFQPLSLEDIWVTGLPRHDFIVREEAELSEDMRRVAQNLRAELGDRKLVLFCPTFRNDEDNPGYRFKAEEVSRLTDWLASNNAVLGIREHMADKQATYSSQLQGAQFLPMPAEEYPDIEVLYRLSDCLITDYSSCFFDYMLTGKPAISFAHDYEHYSQHERGTFYDLETVFPGEVCDTFDALMAALGSVAASGFVKADPGLQAKRDLMLSFTDDRNAERVVQRLQSVLHCAAPPQDGARRTD